MLKDKRDRLIAITVAVCVIAFCTMVATIAVSSLKTNTEAQVACIDARGSWTTSPGNVGKSCLFN